VWARRLGLGLGVGVEVRLLVVGTLGGTLFFLRGVMLVGEKPVPVPG
jgi:hypothetical protein